MCVTEKGRETKKLKLVRNQLLLLESGLPVTGFPWTNMLSSSELARREMGTCGYPGDKEAGSMWRVGGKIQKVDDHRVYYMADTYGGQSGSPVFLDIGN